MAQQLEPSGMSVGEKLDLMEQLWAELSAEPESVPSPPWHGEVLRERGEDPSSDADESVRWKDARGELLAWKG